MDIPKLICACGCGETIPWRPHYSYKPARYLPGHQGRGKSRSMSPPPDWIAPSGICECGCGQPTTVAKQSSLIHNEYRGFPRHFVKGHHMRGRTGATANAWNGGRYQNKRGYWLVFLPSHPRANSGGYVYEHRLVWEEHHGRLLGANEDIHHLDGNPANNAPANLVAIARASHSGLHLLSDEARARATRSDPTITEHRSDAQKRRYSDPDERQRHSERMRQWWAERKSHLE